MKLIIKVVIVIHKLEEYRLQKGYVTNNSKTTSPNVILKDIKGRCQTNADRTALIFNSRNWLDPIEYFENKDKK